MATIWRVKSKSTDIKSQIQGGQLYDILSLSGAEIYLCLLLLALGTTGADKHFSDEAGDLLS